jgi:hypothetical protein
MSQNSSSFSGRAIAVLLVATGVGWVATRQGLSTRSSDAEIQVKDPLGATSRPASRASSNAPIGASRSQLIELAFEAASAMPVRPHLKNRSVAQEDVVTLCLELDQPERAIGYADRIDNWRRGACHADYALHQAGKGRLDGVEKHLEIASKVADEHAKSESSQDWQRDRIRGKIARTWLLLGQPAKAREYAAGLVESEASGLAALNGSLSDPAKADERLAAMDEVFAKGNLDEIRNQLDVCVQMFGALANDAGRKARIEAAVAAGVKKIPPELGIEAYGKLIKAALEKQDSAQALDLLKKARTILEGARWLAEERIRQAALLAAVRSRCGERQAARENLEALLAGYAYEREKIVDIYRAGALRAIAEGFQAVGDPAAALDVYKRALEEGVGNPNSRPRAEDLVATCLSMARSGVDPDAPLWKRMQEVRKALGDPW